MTRLSPQIKFALLTMLAAVLAFALAGAAPASASPRVERVEVRGSTDEVLDYWTRARMRAAEPLAPEVTDAPAVAPAPEAAGPPTVVPPAEPRSEASVPLLRGSVRSATRRGGSATVVPDPTAQKIRAHGKVFFTLPGLTNPDRVCSGTAINSRNRSLVLTAGHCTFDAASGVVATNFVFVPAYRGAGTPPFGTWAAKALAYPTKWKRGGNLAYDIGAAVMKRNESGQRLQSVVGARGIGFDQPRDQKYRAFGYPVEDRFAGSQDEHQCRSGAKGSDVPASGPSTIRIACDMTGGASGGGWIAGGKALVSLTSYYYQSQPNSLFGPYFSSTAKALYKKVR